MNAIVIKRLTKNNLTEQMMFRFYVIGTRCVNNVYNFLLGVDHK